MHTYRKINETTWQVGYWLVSEHEHGAWWRVVKTLPTEDDAAAYTSYLNGGSKPA
jgi:hypothetical protein